MTQTKRDALMERTVSVLSRELKDVQSLRESLMSELEKYEDQYLPETEGGPSPVESSRLAKGWIDVLKDMLAEVYASVFLVTEGDPIQIKEKAVREARDFLTAELGGQLVGAAEKVREAEKIHSKVHTRTFSEFTGTAEDFDPSVLKLHKRLRDNLMKASSTISPVFKASVKLQVVALSRAMKEILTLTVKG